MTRVTTLIEKKPLPGSNVSECEFYTADMTPHWRRAHEITSGHQLLRVQAAPPRQDGSITVGCWLQLNAGEHAKLAKTGRFTDRETMLTIYGPQAIRRLRDLCNAALGEDPQAAKKEPGTQG